MAATELRFVALVGGHGAGPRVQAATDGGSIRTIPLTRANLVRIIKEAAEALDFLDREEARRHG